LFFDTADLQTLNIATQNDITVRIKLL